MENPVVDADLAPAASAGAPPLAVRPLPRPLSDHSIEYHPAPGEITEELSRLARDSAHRPVAVLRALLEEPDAEEHAEIIGSLAAHDPERAAVAMKAHVEEAGRTLLAAMRNQP